MTWWGLLDRKTDQLVTMPVQRRRGAPLQMPILVPTEANAYGILQRWKDTLSINEAADLAVRVQVTEITLCAPHPEGGMFSV